MFVLFFGFLHLVSLDKKLYLELKLENLFVVLCNFKKDPNCKILTKYLEFSLQVEQLARSSFIETKITMVKKRLPKLCLLLYLNYSTSFAIFRYNDVSA